jgi:hypothetical protein
MPIFSYLLVVGSVLVAWLFVTDATLEKGTQAVVTSSQYGLPKPWRPDPTQSLAAVPAAEPDLTSEVVLTAAPVVAKVEPKERVVRAETPKKKRVAPKQPRPEDLWQNHAWSRDPGPFGGRFFGRF